MQAEFGEPEFAVLKKSVERTQPFEEAQDASCDGRLCLTFVEIGLCAMRSQIERDNQHSGCSGLASGFETVV
jgi:hypothetical protein